MIIDRLERCLQLRGGGELGAREEEKTKEVSVREEGVAYSSRGGVVRKVGMEKSYYREEGVVQDDRVETARRA